MTNGIETINKTPLGCTIKRGFKNYGKGFKRLIPVSIVFAVVWAFFYKKMFATIASLSPQTIDHTSYFGWLFALIILGVFFKSLLLLIASDVDQPFRFGHKFKMALIKLFFILIASLVCFLCNALASLLFVIPGIFLAILLIFFDCAILLDNKGVFASIGFSAKLVWGNWWRTVAVMLIPLLINLVISIALTFVIIFSLGHAAQNESSCVWFMPVFISMAFILPLFSTFKISIYEDLKKGHDL
jgi:hypothetical protein